MTTAPVETRPSRSPRPAILPRIDPWFRWRGTDVSRLEGFSDAAFAFAMAYLVFSSASGLQSFEDLWESVKGFLPFAATFAILCMIWGEHYLYFRRYGIRDGFTVVLNCVFLFIFLFYVFPLKFMFTALFLMMLGGQGDPTVTIGGIAFDQMVDAAGRLDMGTVMLCYNAGFGGLYLLLVFMYRHALRLAQRLELDRAEVRITRNGVESSAIMVGFAVVSSVCALLARNLELVVFHPISGFVYFLIGPVLGIHGWRRGNLVRRLGIEDRGGDGRVVTATTAPEG